MEIYELIRKKIWESCKFCSKKDKEIREIIMDSPTEIPLKRCAHARVSQVAMELGWIKKNPLSSKAGCDAWAYYCSIRGYGNNSSKEWLEPSCYSYKKYEELVNGKTIEFKCHECGKVLRTPKDDPLKSQDCPNCDSVTRLKLSQLKEYLGIV